MGRFCDRSPCCKLYVQCVTQLYMLIFPQLQFQHFVDHCTKYSDDMLQLRNHVDRFKMMHADFKLSPELGKDTPLNAPIEAAVQAIAVASTITRVIAAASIIMGESESPAADAAALIEMGTEGIPAAALSKLKAIMNGTATSKAVPPSKKQRVGK